MAGCGGLRRWAELWNELSIDLAALRNAVDGDGFGVGLVHDPAALRTFPPVVLAAGQLDRAALFSRVLERPLGSWKRAHRRRCKTVQTSLVVAAVGLGEGGGLFRHQAEGVHPEVVHRAVALDRGGVAQIGHRVEDA